MEEGPVAAIVGEVQLQDSITIGTGDSITVRTSSPDESQDIIVESEIEEKVSSANSSFSEATDEGNPVDEGLESDSLDGDDDEIMVLEDS